MRVLFTIADLQPDSGGPSRSVGSLATALAMLGVEVEVIALEYGGDTAAPVVPRAPVRTFFAPCHGGLGKRLKVSSEFKSVLRTSLSARGEERRGEVAPLCPVRCPAPQAVLHDNGLWLPTNHAAASVARRLGVPFMVSPRGMLTKWALRYRGLKKRIAWHLYQKRDLRSAQVLHATSPAEAEGVRALGLTQPIALIPNGVELPPDVPLSPSRPPHSARRSALFLGRIHPIKGLMDLVKAWAVVKADGGRLKSWEWTMIIAGNDEGGHQAELQTAIRLRGLESDFQFVGPCQGDAKWGLYRNADLVILPSHSENFGLVVGEALACGVPVIATRGTPWEDLNTSRCGWWVPLGVEPLANGLRQAMMMADTERIELGRRGRELVRAKYSWSRVAEQMYAVYRWMLGLGEKPERVIY